MQVKLEDLVRFYEYGKKYSAIEGLQDACEMMCSAAEGRNPAEFTNLQEFIQAHAMEERCPFFAMPCDELVGHTTICGSPGSFDKDFVTLIKNHGATTVVFFADLSGWDILNDTVEPATVSLFLSGGGYDADCSQMLAANWSAGLSSEAIALIEAAGATTLEEAHDAIGELGKWSWRPESHLGWTICESE